MEFKLDENLGRTIKDMFQEEGHDYSTVRDEGLAGAADPTVLKAACDVKTRREIPGAGLSGFMMERRNYITKYHRKKRFFS